MSLNPTAPTQYAKYCNFTNPNKDNYKTSIVATVLAIQEAQATVFGTNEPAWATDRNGQILTDRRTGEPLPKMNIRFIMVDEEGNLLQWETPKLVGKKKIADVQAGRRKSVHWDIFQKSGNDLRNLIGKTVTIQTAEGNYGAGNPRPWAFEIVEGIEPYVYEGELPSIYKVERVMADSAVSGGRAVVNAAPQQVQQPQPQPTQYPQSYSNQPGYQQAMQAQQYFAQGNAQAYAQVAQPQMVQQPMQQAQPYNDGLPF